MDAYPGLLQARTHIFFYLEGADPEAVYNLFYFKNHVTCNITLSATAFLYMQINVTTYSMRGPGSAGGIAIGYGLDGPGIESRWGEIFRICPDQP